MIVILDNIRSLHNVGSILRTADAFGVEKLYLCGITPSPLDRFGAVRAEVAKTALGAEKTVAWEQVESADKLITQLKKEGFKIFALEQASGSLPIYNLSPKTYNLPELALVLGAEVEGVSKTILAKADTILEIPMRGTKESLNVAVAFGIAAYELNRNNESRTR